MAGQPAYEDLPVRLDEHRVSRVGHAAGHDPDEVRGDLATGTERAIQRPIRVETGDGELADSAIGAFSISHHHDLAVRLERQVVGRV